MDRIDTLENLLIHEIKDLYSAEKQLVKALPKVAKKAHSPQLKQAIEEHLEQTEEHVNRLEQVFEMLGQSAKAVTCKGMEGILDEGEDAMSMKGTPETLDAAIIAAAQKVEHYEIASYGSARDWAKHLGLTTHVATLQQTLDEEKHADHLLTTISQRTNSSASMAA